MKRSEILESTGVLLAFARAGIDQRRFQWVRRRLNPDRIPLKTGVLLACLDPDRIPLKYDATQIRERRLEPCATCDAVFDPAETNYQTSSCLSCVGGVGAQ